MTKIISKKPLAFYLEKDLLCDRLDVSYHNPLHLEVEKELERSPYKVKNVGSGDISIVITNGYHGTIDYSQTGIPFLRGLNIGPFEIVNKSLKLISIEQNRRIDERYRVKTGDVLVTAVGTIGVSAVVSQAENGYAFSRDLIKITPSNQINAMFLSVFLNSELGRSQMLREATGTTVRMLSPKSLFSLRIPIPPIEVQNEVASIMEEAILQSRFLEKEAIRVTKEAESRVKEIIEGNIKPKQNSEVC